MDDPNEVDILKKVPPIAVPMSQYCNQFNRKNYYKVYEEIQSTYPRSIGKYLGFTACAFILTAKGAMRMANITYRNTAVAAI